MNFANQSLQIITKFINWSLIIITNFFTHCKKQEILVVSCIKRRKFGSQLLIKIQNSVSHSLHKMRYCQSCQRITNTLNQSWQCKTQILSGSFSKKISNFINVLLQNTAILISQSWQKIMNFLRQLLHRNFEFCQRVLAKYYKFHQLASKMQQILSASHSKISQNLTANCSKILQILSVCQQTITYFVNWLKKVCQFVLRK